MSSLFLCHSFITGRCLVSIHLWMIDSIGKLPSCSGSTLALTKVALAPGCMECTYAMIETLWDYCPHESRTWWHSMTHIGTKMLYLPKPDPLVWVVPISSILGRLPLVPLGDTGTIPRSMNQRRQACFPQGICDKLDEPGSGSACFYINTWAIGWGPSIWLDVTDAPH